MKMADLPSSVIHKIRDDADDEPAEASPIAKIGRNRTTQVLELLAESNMTSDQIAERLKLDMKSVNRIMGALARAGRIRCVGRALRPPENPLRTKRVKLWAAR